MKKGILIALSLIIICAPIQASLNQKVKDMQTRVNQVLKSEFLAWKKIKELNDTVRQLENQLPAKDDKKSLLDFAIEKFYNKK